MQEPVTRRQLIVAVVVAALLAAAAGAAAGAALSPEFVDRGPRGHVGPRGPKGAPGAAAKVTPEEIYGAIEQEPRRIAEAVQGELDAEALQPQLRPDPQDVQDDLKDLCGQLESAEALADDRISCP
jgi:hypothetical protein